MREQLLPPAERLQHARLGHHHEAQALRRAVRSLDEHVRLLCATLGGQPKRSIALPHRSVVLDPAEHLELGASAAGGVHVLGHGAQCPQEPGRHGAVPFDDLTAGVDRRVPVAEHEAGDRQRRRRSGCIATERGHAREPSRNMPWRLGSGPAPRRPPPT